MFIPAVIRAAELDAERGTGTTLSPGKDTVVFVLFRLLFLDVVTVFIVGAAQLIRIAVSAIISRDFGKRDGRCGSEQGSGRGGPCLPFGYVTDTESRGRVSGNIVRGCGTSGLGEFETGVVPSDRGRDVCPRLGRRIDS
jgi:hypothetical protein